MQIVIDIPEDVKAVIDRNGTNEVVAETLWQATKNGTPLPKKHGRLIDADTLKISINKELLIDERDLDYDVNPANAVRETLELINDAKSVIEADTESEGQGMTSNNLCNSCTNIGCEFQSGIVRTKCAFYIPPHIEPDNCGNYVVMQSTAESEDKE